MVAPPKYSMRKKADSVMQELVCHVLDSHLHRGDRLPSQRALAQQLNVSSFTVYKALQGLAAEGFVEIRDKVGVFLATDATTGKIGRTIGITTAGIESSPSAYNAFLTLMIQDKLFQNGCNTILFPRMARYDRLQIDSIQAAYPGLEEAVARHWISAVIDISGIPRRFTRELRKRGIPVTYCGGEYPVESGVFIDYTEYFSNGMSDLYSLGCRRPALLGAGDDYIEPPSKKYRQFLQEHSIVLPRKFEGIYQLSEVSEGRRLARRILALPPDLRPDGWLFNDEFRGNDFLEGLKYLSCDEAGYHPRVVTMSMPQIPNSTNFDGMIFYERDVAVMAEMVVKRILRMARGEEDIPNFQYYKMKRLGTKDFMVHS